ncbi:hypothetical protein ACFQ3W_25865 [Paenibacillus puldeungensis]|uniref:Uncharacterized protein n=1 Tax=Paenibacillus puldeungensis TaxID=696536 RepID=A0ABW3S4L1_9BACL
MDEGHDPMADPGQPHLRHNNIYKMNGVMVMKVGDALDQVFRISMLQEPTDEIRNLLCGQSFERALELLLLLRMTPKVRNVPGFLRRAIQEGWTPSTLPQKIDRRLEGVEERYYLRKGYSPDQAHEKVLENRENFKRWNEE